MDDVNRLRQKLKDALDESCDKIVEEINHKKNIPVSEMRVAMSCIEKEIEATKGIIYSICIEIRDKGSRLIDYNPVIPDTKSFELPQVSNYPIFVPNKFLVDKFASNVGKLSFSVKRKSDGKKAVSKKLKIDPLPSTSIVKVSIVSSFDAKSSGSVISPAGEDTAWVAYDGAGDIMALYDRAGKEIRINVCRERKSSARPSSQTKW